jgi:hypothetical protein
MRSIGKRNIDKLKKIVAEECAVSRQYSDYIGAVTRGRIRARVPEAWEDIWESAGCEIDRIIDDEMSRIRHQKTNSMINSKLTTEAR